MNLKNRFAAIATVAAIAIPAIAFAAKYVESGDSSIVITGSATAGIGIEAKGDKSAISVLTDGPNTIVKLDGWNLTTGKTFAERDEHMKEFVFGWVKADGKKQKPEAEGKRYFELIVPTDKIAKGLADGKIDAIIKTPKNGNGKKVQVTAFKKTATGVHGEFNTSMPDLGFPTKSVCKKALVAEVCVKDPLTIVADLGIKTE
jgi:hypothetical protein